MNLAALYQDLPLGVCVIRRDRKTMDILYTNPAMAGLVGLKPANLTGHKFEDSWPHKDAQKLAQQLKSPTPPSSFILPAGERWIKLDIARGNWDGQDSYSLFASDISDLQAEVEKADAAAEMKSNFLATMSHEIRTPMQTIYGLLELIGEEKPEARIQSMVDIAKTSASSLLEILDDVLDLAKMDANKMDLDVFEVPVRTLVRGILEALAVKVHGADVQLRDDIAQDVPFVIIGDPKRLRQIIMNLAGNALKFTKEGTVTVRVTKAVQNIAVPDKHVGLRFEVIDTGIGMSEEACGRLFQSFSQADNSTSRKYGGTGLGLSISRKLTELMGGKIGVISKEGQGSNFWFEIPTEEVGTDTTTVALPSLDGISVLSVEDHPQGGKEIVNSLRSMGAKVELCPTYAEGLALVRRRPFDVGVIDQGLPDGLGLDLVREIMELRPYMGLVMYTVRDDVGLQHSLQSLGVTYLTKPASRAGLGEAVKAAANKTRRISTDGPTRLLIAEDTESVRDVLQRQLNKLGVEADFVSDGLEALKALKTGKYGILITDLHMPGLDGYQLAGQIREEEVAQASTHGEGDHTDHFPVIVLTADVQMAQREAYMRHGFDECLLKPVSLGQFRRLLIRWGLLAEQPAPDASDASSAPANGQPPAIDIEAMKEQMGAFDEGAIEMLGMFVDMTQPLIERIAKAQAHGDFSDLKEAAHSLKGGARSACCMVLGDMASKLQDNSEKKIPSAKLVEDIAREFERVRTEVKNLKVA